MRFKGHKDDQEQMGSVSVRSHVAAGKPRRVRLQVSFGMLLTGEILIPSRSRREWVMAVFMCLCLSYYPVFMWRTQVGKRRQNDRHTCIDE